MKKNADVWALMAYYDVSTLDLAEAMNVSQSKISRILRNELEQQEKNLLMDHIKELGQEGDAANE